MASEFYGYFDSVTGDARSYTADQLAAAFRALSGDGTADITDSLKVIPKGDAMAVTVMPGACVIHGYFYALTDDGGATKDLTLSAAGAAPRIDLVVARLNLGTGTGDRKISLAVKEGAPAATPTVPALTNTAAVKEIALARVSVPASVTAIAASHITDARTPMGPRVVGSHTHGEATDTAAGMMPADDKRYVNTLKANVAVSATAIDLGGKYIDNALFR